MKEKINATPNEFSKALWYLCKKLSKSFYEDFKPEAEKAGFKLNAESEITFAREIIMMNLWIISKTLSPDTKVLDELHKIYLFGHSSMAETEWVKVELPKQAEKELHERYKKYYEAWNDKAGGGQFILALTILEYLLNYGKPDKRLLNIMLSRRVIMHILATMKVVLESRKGFEIIDEDPR